MFRKLTTNGRDQIAAQITIDGASIWIEDGEPLAAILLRFPPHISRTTPVTGRSRAPYCMMGACFDCVVDVDGQTSVRSCLVLARPGMRVERQKGRPHPVLDSQHD